MKRRNKKKELIARAEVMQHHCDLLIEQCDSWLSAEEGNRIMEERMRRTTCKTANKK